MANLTDTSTEEPHTAARCVQYVGIAQLHTQYTESNRKIRNIEIFRFFFAWAIVGFHIVSPSFCNGTGLGFLIPYLTFGENAVGCFYVLAFYFLVRGHSIRQSLLTFVCRKWLRLAPLIIVVSVFGYILYRCGYWRWSWTANIEQWLLIHDWAAWPRWGQFVQPAWWCSCYMLVSVTYLALARALPERYLSLALGILAVVGWHIFCISRELPRYETIFFPGGAARTFFFLGIGALTAHIVRHIEAQPSLRSSSTFVTWGYTLAEVGLTGALLARLFAARYMPLLNPLLTTLCFSAILVLFILRRGYFSRLLENNLSSFLGRYAYAIFVVHCLVLSSARSIILPYFKAEFLAHPWVVLGCIAGVTMLLAMAGHHFVERPIMRFCNGRVCVRLAGREKGKEKQP